MLYQILQTLSRTPIGQTPTTCICCGRLLSCYVDRWSRTDTINILYSRIGAQPKAAGCFDYARKKVSFCFTRLRRVLPRLATQIALIGRQLPSHSCPRPQAYLLPRSSRIIDALRSQQSRRGIKLAAAALNIAELEWQCCICMAINIHDEDANFLLQVERFQESFLSAHEIGRPARTRG